jgi:hypothetical protein
MQNVRNSVHSYSLIYTWLIDRYIIVADRRVSTFFLPQTRLLHQMHTVAALDKIFVLNIVHVFVTNPSNSAMTVVSLSYIIC